MNATVVYAGRPGAFAEEACRAFLPDHEAVACTGFGEVTAAVSQEAASLGMLPLENNIAGAVPGVALLIAQAGLDIAERHSLPVRLHLLGVADARIDEVRVVRSHPMALAQCTSSLAKLGLEQEAADNTAAAALRLAVSAERSAAVLASARAASCYGLNILQSDLQDRPDNRTLFAVVRRRTLPS